MEEREGYRMLTRTRFLAHAPRKVIYYLIRCGQCNFDLPDFSWPHIGHDIKTPQLIKSRSRQDTYLIYDILRKWHVKTQHAARHDDKILSITDGLKEGLIQKIGDGSKIYVWRENWIPRAKALKPLVISRMQKQIVLLVGGQRMGCREGKFSLRLIPITYSRFRQVVL